MKNKINAYLLRVDEKSGAVYHGYLAEVENDLKAEQLYVNYNQPHGLIEVIRLNDKIVAIMNEEGKIKNFYVNRILLGENEKVLDFIVGNIMCVRCDVDGCLLHNKNTKSCKAKMEKVASPFWRKLQLHQNRLFKPALVRL